LFLLVDAKIAVNTVSVFSDAVVGCPSLLVDAKIAVQVMKTT